MNNIPTDGDPPIYISILINYLRDVEGDKIRMKYKIAGIGHQFSWGKPGGPVVALTQENINYVYFVRYVFVDCNYF